MTKNIISIEFPSEWRPGDEPYYPVSYNDENDKRLDQYLSLANGSNVIFLGRLGTYKYLDMDKAIQQAFSMFDVFRQFIEK